MMTTNPAFRVNFESSQLLIRINNSHCLAHLLVRLLVLHAKNVTSRVFYYVRHTQHGVIS